jgi:hypothetical protein
MKPFSVCILGSSHLGALKQAWDKGAPVSPALSVDFFGATGWRLEDLRYENGALRPQSDKLRKFMKRTSGGKESIVIDSYDAFVLYGLALDFRELLRFCRDYGTFAHRKWGAVANLLSESCFSASIETWIGASNCMDYLAQIRTLHQKPVLVCPRPLPPESFYQTLRDGPPRLLEPEFLALLFAEFRAQVLRLCGKFGGETCWQDDATLASPGATRNSFSLPPRSSDKEHNVHMNAQFGHLMMMKILERLDEISRGRALLHAVN